MKVALQKLEVGSYCTVKLPDPNFNRFLPDPSSTLCEADGRYHTASSASPLKDQSL